MKDVAYAIRLSPSVLDSVRKTATSLSITASMPVSINTFLSKAIERGIRDAKAEGPGFLLCKDKPKKQ